MSKLLLTFLLLLFPLHTWIHADYSYSVHTRGKHDWNKNLYTVLEPTPRQPARTAILIIAAPHLGDDFTGRRWALGKQVWEQYMNTHPNVDCYFLQPTYPRKDSSEQVWLEGNTIYVGDWWYEQHHQDRILYKTIMALEKLLPHYTHFIRTNANSFFNLKAVNDYAETHHQSMYTGPLWQGEWYVVGYGILFTADVAAHIVSEYRRLDGLDIVSSARADDCTLTSLATGVYPLNDAEHQFCCCPSLPFGVRQLMSPSSLTTKRLSEYGALLLPPISLSQAIAYCDQAPETMMLYRIREGFSLDELKEFYHYLIKKHYPE